MSNEKKSAVQQRRSRISKRNEGSLSRWPSLYRGEHVLGHGRETALSYMPSWPQCQMDARNSRGYRLIGKTPRSQRGNSGFESL